MNKFFAEAAYWLALNKVEFKFSGEYISCRFFDISLDANNKKKIWCNVGDDWCSFTKLSEFNNFVNTTIVECIANGF